MLQFSRGLRPRNPTFFIPLSTDESHQLGISSDNIQFCFEDFEEQNDLRRECATLSWSVLFAHSLVVEVSNDNFFVNYFASECTHFFRRIIMLRVEFIRKHF